ncbi:sporulation integral membrane protein YtvI [Marininema halotolerans]|uniref:Sporulation integral membrane protein YtvI n=1 Tax=Marininema halotolerans TaxID=1155944 RepID=A0A1I6S3J4_9BACL|nr:sporulation integral membrane protein YtvI [Marininema halotolerans]SFS71450.1 sporulation integral membrane protein YtvI [Marininema halotolerans]
MNREVVWPIARGLLVIAVAIVGYYFLLFAVPLVYPFFIGWMIAMLAEPIVRWLELRFRVPRWAGVTITLLLLIAILLTLLILLVSEIVVVLIRLSDWIPAWINDINTYILSTFFNGHSELSQLIDNIQNYLEKNPQQRSEIVNSIQNNIGIVANKGTQLITDIISGIGTFLGNLPYFATVLVFCVLAAFFIAFDWPRLKRSLQNLIPHHVQHTGSLIIVDLKRALFGFMRAQLTLISITGFIVWIGLMIIGIRYALTIAIVTAIVDLLPYLGVGSVLIPWSLVLLLTGDIEVGIGLAILYLIIILVRQTIEPKLVASNIGLNPLFTLFALFVGLKLMGVIGLIAGPTLAVILIALYRAHVFRDLWNYIRNGRTPLQK